MGSCLSLGGLILGLDLSFWGASFLGLVELTESDGDTADCEEHRNDEDDEDEEVADRLDEVLEEVEDDDALFNAAVADGDDDDGNRLDGYFNDDGADTDDNNGRDNPACTGCPNDDDDNDVKLSETVAERRGNPELT